MKFVILNNEEFQNFASNHPLRHFLQSTYMEKLENGFGTIYVGVKKDGKVIAGARLAAWTHRFGKKYFYAPRGLLMNYKDKEVVNFFTKSLKKYLKSQNGYVLKIDPLVIYKERDIDGNIVGNGINNEEIFDHLKKIGYKHMGFNTWYDYKKQVRFVFTKDLKNKTEEQLLKEMKSNTRKLVTKAINYGVQIRQLEKDELYKFVDILNETGTRRGFKNKDIKYFEKMYDIFNDKNKVSFLLAEIDVCKYLDNLEKEYDVVIQKLGKIDKESKEIVDLNNMEVSLKKRIDDAKKIIKEDGNKISLASSMFLSYEGEMYYLYGGSIEKYMFFNAQHLLQWDRIKYSLKNNIYKYNFYGITGNFDKNDPEYGVYNFKRGFNGIVEEYLGEFELPLDNYYYINKLISKIRRR